MKVGIGYSDNPDSSSAAVQAAKMAISQAKRNDSCDLVLLFSTFRHDQQLLREGVASVTGKTVPIYGGGAIGIITNDYYGYEGDQIIIACIWLDDIGCKVFLDKGLKESPVIPLDESLAIMKTLDHIRKDNGLSYPCEN